MLTESENDWRCEEFRVHAEDNGIQHRRLTGLIDALLKALREERSPKIVNAAFRDVVAYVELHFSDEEEFMKRHRYPAGLLQTHALSHELALNRLLAMRDDESGVINPEALVSLKEWLFTEEAAHDQAYLDYFCKGQTI